MVLINPLLLLLGQQRRIDEFLAVRHHGDMLEAEIRLVAEPMCRLRFFRDDHVLDADAEAAVFVVARLVGQDVAGRERDFGKRDARADADGAFVHVEIGADAVACAVAVIQAFAPKELAREGVDLEPGGAFGEDGGVDRDHAFEDERVGFALQVRGRAKVQGPGGVGGAVEILGARVAEIDCFWVDRGA